MYLKEEAIDAVLQSVGAFPPGSEIVLTIASQTNEAHALIAKHAAGIGEPWVSCFEPDDFAAKLTGTGFSKVGFLSTEEAEARYFSKGHGELPVPNASHILFAVV